MTTSAPRPDRRIFAPPAFPTHRYVAMLNHPLVRGFPRFAGAAGFRRDACRDSPILFALTYLPDHLRMPGSRAISLSEFHVALATSAKRWARTDVGLEEIRDAWVAPREGAKSTWLLLILALWAMAYRHRWFILAFADTTDQAQQHLATLRQELADNERIRHDFPELCTPLRRDGKVVRDNKGGYVAASGAAIVVKGMDAATLGAKIGARRPDLLLFDDIEPKAGDYSLEQKRKRLDDLVSAIFPVNLRAIVQIAGTTVMYGSIIHDLIESRRWVREENIQVHHFRAILTDPVTGAERSLWPQKWPLEFLLSRRGTRKYAMNFDNEPVNPNGTYWSQSNNDIAYASEVVRRHITERILVIDPAAKSTKKNDETGIGMLAYAANVRKVIVERVMGVRLAPAPLRERVHSILRANSSIKLVLVDVTNGGDHVLNTLEPLPPGVVVKPVHISRRSKADRFADLLDRYQRHPRQVEHARRLPTVEAQMYAYPKTAHDDQIDVVALGVEYFFDELNGK